MKNLFKISVIILTITVISVSFSSCKSKEILKLATTTSTDNTGLLDYLKPAFEKDTGITLQWVAVGTGKALKLGENCDVDALLVHAPGAEKKFVDAGHGIDRTEIMFNDFVVIGPKNDPAKIKSKNAAEALKIIHSKKALFASRGDNSGTNKKEIKLWIEAEVTTPDKEKWYIQTGQGMINTINIAEERSAYTITDRGTYIKYESNSKGNPPLVILVEGDTSLKNQYSTLSINPTKCKNVKYKLATKFKDWISGKKAQKMINDFKLLGKQLFKANAIK